MITTKTDTFRRCIQKEVDSAKEKGLIIDFFSYQKPHLHYFNILDIFDVGHITAYEYVNLLRGIDGEKRNEYMVSISYLRKLRLVSSEIIHEMVDWVETRHEIHQQIVYEERLARRNEARQFTGNTEVRSQVFDMHGESCLRCGSTDNITLDHVTPIARGGEDIIENMQPLCCSCNSWKGTRIIDYREVQV